MMAAILAGDLTGSTVDHCGLTKRRPFHARDETAESMDVDVRDLRPGTVSGTRRCNSSAAKRRRPGNVRTTRIRAMDLEFVSFDFAEVATAA